MKKAHILLLFLLGILTFGLSSCENDEPEEPSDDPVLYKPNIYLYPETEMEIEVKLHFPLGGEIIASIPDYKTGWKVNVTPEGIINGEYSYLFYESTQPNKWQQTKAWIIEKDNLSEFFTENMSEYGFAGKEIDDYLEYWIPRLTEHKYYLIYPQTELEINPLVQLSIQEAPDNLLRLYYLIQGTENPDKYSQIETPEIINEFERTGYFVTEWGVLLY